VRVSTARGVIGEIYRGRINGLGAWLNERKRLPTSDGHRGPKSAVTETCTSPLRDYQQQSTPPVHRGVMYGNSTIMNNLTNRGAGI
jgi:hypothetical protein